LSWLLPAELFVEIPGDGGWVEKTAGAFHRDVSTADETSHEKEHRGAHREAWRTFEREIVWLWWLGCLEGLAPRVPKLLGVDLDRRRIRLEACGGPPSLGGEVVAGLCRRNTDAPHVLGDVAVGFSWATHLCGDLGLGGLVGGPLGCPWHPTAASSPCRLLLERPLGPLCTQAPLTPLASDVAPKRIALVLRGIGAAWDTPSLWRGESEKVEVGWRAAAPAIKRLVDASGADVFFHAWAGDDVGSEIAAMLGAYRPVRFAIEPLATRFDEEFAAVAEPGSDDLTEMGFNPKALQRTWSMLRGIQRAVATVRDLDSYDLVAVMRSDGVPPPWLELRSLRATEFTVLTKQDSAAVRAHPREGLHEWFVAGPPAAIRNYATMADRAAESFRPDTPRFGRSMHDFARRVVEKGGVPVRCLHARWVTKSATCGGEVCVPGMCHASCAGACGPWKDVPYTDATSATFVQTARALGIPAGQKQMWLGGSPAQDAASRVLQGILRRHASCGGV